MKFVHVALNTSRVVEEVSDSWEPRKTAEKKTTQKNLPYRKKLPFSHSWSLEFNISLAGIIKVKENFKEVVLCPLTSFITLSHYIAL